MNFPTTLRLVAECAGVVSAYSLVNMTRSSQLFEIKGSDEYAQRLIQYRHSLANEGAEVLTKLHENFYREVDRLHKEFRSKEEVSGWIKSNVFGKRSEEEVDIPQRLSANKMTNEYVIDSLRLIPVEKQQNLLRFPNQSGGHMTTAPVALSHLLSEFYSLENEIMLTFILKQKQISRVMESYQTKLFVESPEGKSAPFISSTFKLLSCAGCSMLLSKLWSPVASEIKGSIFQKNKFPKYGKLMTGAFLVLAYVVSEDDEEVNDYSLESAYDSADLPLPLFFHLPPLQYAGVIPPIYKPGQSAGDRLSRQYLGHVMYEAITDGFIFRKVLFGSLCSIASARVSHVFAALTAATVMCIEEGSGEAYHPIVDEGNTFGASESLAREMSFSLPVRPLLMQGLLFASGRFYVTIVVDVLMRLKEEIKHEMETSDDYWMLFRKCGAYEMACNAIALFDRVTTPVGNFVGKLFSHNNEMFEDLSKKIVDRYIAKRGEDVLSKGSFETEEMIALERSVLFGFLTMQQQLPMSSLIPAPFGKSSKRPPGPFGPEESEVLRQISGVDNESLARVTAFIEDSERVLLNEYYGGAIDFPTASSMLQQMVVRDALWKENFDNDEKKELFLQRVLFWDEEATEENLLDLLQEFYDYILAKKMFHAEDFAYVQGRAFMLNMECNISLGEEDMRHYYNSLEMWLQHATELEEVNFLSRYGLTKYKLSRLVAQRSSCIQLNERWERYLESMECKKLVEEKADPIRLFREKRANGGII